MTIKKLLSILVCFMLISCGGEVSIGYHSGGTSADIDSDLFLTVQVDEGQQTGFTTRIGPDGGAISLNSGQQLRIIVDEPVVLTVDANGADIELISSSSTLWEGIVSSATDRNLVFRFASLYYPGDTLLLRIDVKS